MTSKRTARLLALGLLAASLLASCRIDRSPDGHYQTRRGTIRLRDASVDYDAFAFPSPADDAGAQAAGACGDGALDPPEACDEGERNGTPGHCDSDCAHLLERVVILDPHPEERVSSPAFFDWEIDGANPDTTYCNLLMTDRSGTPADRMGEQAFYTGTATEMIATLNARRYAGGTFSFAVIAVACDERMAKCRPYECYSGSLCALPCAGRVIVGETRKLRGIEP